jgi:hypothetical protein
MAVQMRYLQECLSRVVNEGSMHRHVLEELAQIDQLVQRRLHADRMQHLVGHRWFLRIIHSLHQYKKKMKTPVRKSLLRFLLAASTLLENGRSIDPTLFYSLVTQLVRPDDQQDVMVHRSLALFRAVIGVDAEAYSQYLAHREIPACPELMAEVREVHRKRDRQLRVHESRVRTKSVVAASVTSTLLGQGQEEEKGGGQNHVLGQHVDTGMAEAAALVTLAAPVAGAPTRLSESAPASLYTSSSASSGSKRAHLSATPRAGEAPELGPRRPPSVLFSHTPAIREEETSS